MPDHERAARAPLPLPEWTLRALIAGLVFGVLFGCANAYLGLKAGLTVSTSIPIAVLSLMLFRFSRRQSPVLEANLAQTVGSASSSLASGTIFTIPALFMWSMVPSYLQVAVLAMLGGVLGILAMVPLRRLLIVQADAELPYPEGRACAEVIRASDGRADDARVSGGTMIVVGILLGALVKVLTTAMHVVPEELVATLPALPNGAVALAVSPALVGVGYVVGFRASAVMLAGSLVASVVLYPLITSVYDQGLELGSGTAQADLARGVVRSRFVLYIGAGAVAAAGLWTVIRTAPTMFASLRAVLRGLRHGSGGTGERTDTDVSAKVIVLGLVAVVAVAAFVPGVFAGDLNLQSRLIAASGAALFAFLFVPVSSRLVGVIGVSSNPTSAMALITLLGTSLVFMALGIAGDTTKATVLTIGTLVCVAASKAGDISQDLKTGWLVGATPALQQRGQLIAAAVACWAVGGVVWAIGKTQGFGDGGMSAPQATLMKTVVEAVLGASVPWPLVLSGAGLSAAGILAGLPGLPFALGIYLPMGTIAAIFVGGVLRGRADRLGKAAADRGILCASGFVAGEGLAGVLIAGWALATGQGRHVGPAATLFDAALGVACIAVAVLVLRRSVRT
jgi:putative OPT family oligopeptide transporter